jgi:hypothetical protein
MALTVEDQLAIQQLYAHYNHCIDSGKAADWAATFTANGVFTGGGGTHTGTDALQTFAKGFATSLPKARHWTNNILVDGDGNGATGTCYLQLHNVTPGSAGLITTGIYRDKLEKTSAGWRFTERTVHPDA